MCEKILNMEFCDLFEDLYCQCQTSDRLTDEICCKLKQLDYNECYQLVIKVKDGVPPLGVAVNGGKLDIVKYLLDEAKVEVDQLCSHTNETEKLVQMTPLMFVKDLAIAQCLVQHGANLNAVAEGRTLLHWQCYFDNDEVIKYLITQRLDINVPMEDGNTLLHCFFGNQELYELFLSSGANVNAQNNFKQTPMHCAILNDKAWAVMLLAQNNADPTLRDHEGFNAIQLACKQMNRDIVNYLMTNVGYSGTNQADIYKLLGGFYVSNYDNELAIECWRMALEIQLNDGEEFLEGMNLLVMPIYKDAKEIHTMEELNAVALNKNKMLIQTFLIFSRILGPDKEETSRCLVQLSSSYIFNVRIKKFHKACYPLQYCMELAFKYWQNCLQKLKKVCCLLSLIILVAGYESRISADGINFDIIVQLVNLISYTLSHSFSKNKCHFLVAILDQMIRMPKTHQQQEHLTEMVKLLVQKRLGHKDSYTMLHAATFSGHLENNEYPGISDMPLSLYVLNFSLPRAPVVNLLLECGHSVECLTTARSTPLHFACMNYDANVNSLDVINSLLAHGAHIDCADSEGFRPSHVLNTIDEFDSFSYVTLKCLAAQTIVKNNVQYKHIHFPVLEAFIEMH